jgi:hypothetical protein
MPPGEMIHCEACNGDRFDRLKVHKPLFRPRHLAVRCFFCEHWHYFPLGLITHCGGYGSYTLRWIA